MNENLYIKKVISRYIPKEKDLVRAKSISLKLYPYIRCWAYPYLSKIERVGSFAKHTNIIGNTDIDLFISLKHTLLSTLKELYKNLADWMRIRGFSVREQNVSIRVNYEGLYVDLIPGKRLPGLIYDHSIYCNKRNTWAKTNVHKHIRHVISFSRRSEIRAIKIWRNLHKLEFPSFYLELSVINALCGSRRALPLPSAKILPNNLQKIFKYLYSDFLDAKIVDPSNSNNIVSDDLSKKEKQAIKDKAFKAYLASIASSWGEIIW